MKCSDRLISIGEHLYMNQIQPRKHATFSRKGSFLPINLLNWSQNFSAGVLNPWTLERQLSLNVKFVAVVLLHSQSEVQNIPKNCWITSHFSCPLNPSPSWCFLSLLLYPCSCKYNPSLQSWCQASMNMALSC